MRRENLAIGLVAMVLRVERRAPNSAKRRQGTVATSRKSRGGPGSPRAFDKAVRAKPPVVAADVN